jgi:hypothetical protein
VHPEAGRSPGEKCYRAVAWVSESGHAPDPEYRPRRDARQHTYTGSDTGRRLIGTFRVAAIDDGQVTKAGAQLSITLTTSALDQITLQLSTRNGRTKTWSGLGTGAITNQAFQLAAPELAGAKTGGIWTLAITGTGTLVMWSLFAEGVGPGGLAGDVLEWGVYLDPAHLGETGFASDLRAVSLAMARIQHAHANGYIVRAFSAAPRHAARDSRPIPCCASCSTLSPAGGLRLK